MSAQRRRKSKGGGQGGGRRSGRAGTATESPTAFWGDSTVVPHREDRVRISEEPDAIVRSLGRPPLAAQAGVGELYFRAVYERAVSLATALAAASDLIELDELDEN